MNFKDICPTEGFITDWEAMPNNVQRLTDRRLNEWAITGCLPPSAHAHRARLNDSDLWIVYLVAAGGCWFGLMVGAWCWYGRSVMQT